MLKKRMVLGAVLVSALFFGLVNYSYAEEKGLIGLWKFDEGEGSTIKDSSGNSNHGTIHGATRTSGKSGRALNFDGVDDYISVPNNDVFNFGTGDMSLSVWVKFSDLSGNIPILSRTVDGMNGFYLSWHQQTKRLRWAVYSDYETNSYWAFLSADWVPKLNTWYNISVTVDCGVDGHIYIDGVDQTLRSNTLNNYDFSISQSLNIGNSGSHFFKGSIDEVKIYNRALSAKEIENYYNDVKQII